MSAPRGPRTIAAVGVGGAIGAVLRSALEARSAPSVASAFPTATFAINVSGAFLLGLVLTLILEVWPPTRLARPFVAIGLLGSFTTLSSFALETVRLLEVGATVSAALYVGSTLVGGTAAVLFGAAMARSLPALARRFRRGRR